MLSSNNTTSSQKYSIQQIKEEAEINSTSPNFYNVRDEFLNLRIKDCHVNDVIVKFNAKYIKNANNKINKIIPGNLTIPQINEVIKNTENKLDQCNRISNWKNGKIPSVNVIRIKLDYLLNCFKIDNNGGGSNTAVYLTFKKHIVNNTINYGDYEPIKPADINDFYNCILYRSYHVGLYHNLDLYLDNKLSCDDEFLKEDFDFFYMNISFRTPLLTRIVWKAIMSPKFNLWFDKILTQKYITLKQIIITDIDMFGPVNVGFIKFTTKYTDERILYKIDPITKKEGDINVLTGIVFMRGDAVAILIILKEIGKNKNIKNDHVILTCQTRIPAADQNYKEIVAGMVDSNTNNIVGVAAKEVQEETGITINTEDTIDLGIMEPSMGGCDERIHLYAYIKEVTVQEMKEYESKLTGNIEEGESITLQVYHMMKFLIIQMMLRQCVLCIDMNDT